MDEGESDYGEEGEEQYTDARMQGRGIDMSQEYDGEEMDEEEEDEFEESHLQQSRQQNQGLEMRLEQIKQNIKSQKQDVRGNQGGYSPSKEQQSIEHLEDVLQAQRQKLNHLQQSSNMKSTHSNKERLDFELSKASPNKASRMRQSSGMKQSGMPGSSSVNLEKAYEDLEKEIMEIK